VHFPNMRVMEGSKGRFVSAPTRKSGEDFIPHYFLNKEMLDLLRRAGMEAFDKATAEKGPASPVLPAAKSAVAVANKPVSVPSEAGPSKPWVRREWKTSASK